MNSRWPEGFPTGRPLAVEGGLKAQSSRGAIGSSWWSRRFLAILESLAIGGRLHRGRNYARKGQVISMEVAPGEVRSVVQGSRPDPYRVTIGLAPLSGAQWAKVEVALSERALSSAKLLAGEVPPELEQVFAAAGAPLFPRAATDLAQNCSCPDWEVPCKHLAATFYLLAEAFDTDPFLILRWRGRDREQLLNRLRELRSGPDWTASASQQYAVPVAAGAALALAGLSAPEFDGQRFWSSPPLPPAPAVLDADPALLLRQLPVPGRALGGAELLERLRVAYDRFAETGG